ncbi:MAG: hypothetical protein WDO13_06790 [Verrucomicrobiota bacterium]
MPEPTPNPGCVLPRAGTGLKSSVCHGMPRSTPVGNDPNITADGMRRFGEKKVCPALLSAVLEYQVSK